MNGDQSRLVHEHLDRILATQSFQRAPRLSRFLRFIVEETLAGRSNELKEYTVGIEVYGRTAGFEPRLDATVRVEAHKLRNRLERYYCSEGSKQRVRFLLRKGSYAPEIVFDDDAHPSLGMELCTEGLALLDQRTPEALRQAYECFWKAVVAYPDFSQAYAGLAAYYVVAGALEILAPHEAWPRARMAAAQARALGNPGTLLSIVESALASVSGDRYRAESITARALKRAPHDAAAHFWYGGVMSAQQRHQEAFEHMRTAALLLERVSHDRSHTRVLCETHVSWSLYHAERYRESRDYLHDRFGREPTNVVVQYHLARTLAELREYDRAIALLKSVYAQVPVGMTASSLGYVSAKAGKRRDAEELLDNLRSQSKSCYVPRIRAAIISRALGKGDGYANGIESSPQDYALIWADVDPQLACSQRN